MNFPRVPSVLRDNAGLISAGFLLIFFSVFGQSVMFGVYIPHIQDELGLTKTSLGSLYAMATIASSIAIIFTGKGLDHVPLRLYVALVLAGVAAGCFVLAGAHHALMLLAAFFLLRQFGQGLMGLSAMTSVNRYLERDRGKAVALVNLGGSAHIMTIPLLALWLDHYFSWRAVWAGYGFFVLLVLLPGFLFYLRRHQSTTHARWETRVKAESEQAVEAIGKQWTRAHVLRDWRFYSFLLISVVPPFLGTAIFFYQRELAEALGLTPLSFAASFPFFTGASVVFSLLAGHVIDKYGEKTVLAAFPIMVTAGLLILTNSTWLPFVFAGMVLVGGANGMMSTTGGPLLAHLYGTKHLGGIKSLVFSWSILASALSPFTFGFFMDHGYGITTQLSWIIYYSGVIWVLAFPICSSAKSPQGET